MRLQCVIAKDFLSLGDFELTLWGGVTVLTGPNGVGKTNVGRCVDLVRTVLAAHAGKRLNDRLELYKAAGRNGHKAFEVSLGLVFDQDWEKSLLLDFMRAAFACNDSAASDEWAGELDIEAIEKMSHESISPLYSGRLRVCFDASMLSPWWVVWEFENEGDTWTVPIVGTGRTDFIHPGVMTPFSISQHPQNDLARFVLNISRQADIEEFRALVRLARDFDLAGAFKRESSKTQLVKLAVPALTRQSNPIPASLQLLANAFGVEHHELYRQAFSFLQVLDRIIERSFVLTENRRIPPRRFFSHSRLAASLDMQDGGNVAARLFQLKNGAIDDRKLYSRVEERFSFLTGRVLGLRAVPARSGDFEGFNIEPTVVVDGREVPLEFSGAGVAEALVLSTLLADSDGRVLVFDEPAVNLEPTMQRRLMSALRAISQCLVITHSPDMVPCSVPEDINGIVRLKPEVDGPEIKRASSLTTADYSRWIQLLEPTHVRALLFAARVILCEGTTETGALPQWWHNTLDLGLVDPEAANIPIVSVDGDSRFGVYVEFLDSFGVPWAIIADGPALRRGSKLAQQLRQNGHAPPSEPDGEDFADWREYWQQAGVFTLAESFGDDGGKQGEFEAYLERLDSDLYERASTQSGKSKPRRGSFFAANHPRPKEISDLYRKIAVHFNL